METKLPCEKHEEQIITLFKYDETTNKRIDSVKIRLDDLTDLKIAITKISTTMDYLVEFNEQQKEINRKQNEVLDNINTNLINLNSRIEKLEEGQENLSKRVDESECKNKIDLRDIEKQKHTDVLLKYVLPSSGITILLLKLLEIIINKINI